MKKPILKTTMHPKQQGSVILEALISILIFSVGILAIIALQADSIRETAAAKYRTDASLLANQVIGQMWVGDKANLATNFASPNGVNYIAWASSVVATMPGVATSPLYAPTITIAAGNATTVTIFWQSPSENTAHRYTATAVINN